MHQYLPKRISNLILCSLVPLTACSTKSSIPQATQSNKEIATTPMISPSSVIAKKPLPVKLYQVNFVECSKLGGKVKLESVCKERFDKGVYVWGKPTAVGILYYTDRGNGARDWSQTEKRPTSKPWVVTTKIFIESEGCGEIPRSAGKKGFYPDTTPPSKLESFQAQSIDKTKAIFLGSVEPVSDEVTHKVVESIQTQNAGLDKDKFFIESRNGNRKIQECLGSAKIHIKPQQIVPILPTYTNQKPKEIHYTKSW